MHCIFVSLSWTKLWCPYNKQFGTSRESSPFPPTGTRIVMSTIKNVSSWKLNKSEMAELNERVSKGESEQSIKRELQTKKAEASTQRIAAAQAVAGKSQAAAKAAPTKAKAKSVAAGAATAPPPDDATNKGYFREVEGDIQRILAEFGHDFPKEMPMAIQTGVNVATSATSGVQDPFCKTKGLAALNTHGVYRCSISIWWINALSSPTPGIPLSRRRVMDLSEYYFGSEGRPQFHTDRMLEIAVSKSDIQTDTPSGLQLISPEEVIHATLAGCSRCIQSLGFFGEGARWLSSLMFKL